MVSGLRDKQLIGEPELVRFDYLASAGKEIYLSYEDRNATLFGHLRLRIQDTPLINAGLSGRETALIRELHVFGPELALSSRQDGAAQHRGYGRALLREAERLAGVEFGRCRVAVLSGVGAREYYRSEGYDLNGNYMVKELGDLT